MFNLWRPVKLSYHPFLSPFRPYKVVWRLPYDLVSSHERGSPYGERNIQGHRWVIRRDAQDWLMARAPAKWLKIFNIASVKFYIRSGLIPFTLKANNGRLEMGGKPPAIWFARKADALIFKLTYGVRDE